MTCFLLDGPLFLMLLAFAMLWVSFSRSSMEAARIWAVVFWLLCAAGNLGALVVFCDFLREPWFAPGFLWGAGVSAWLAWKHFRKWRGRKHAAKVVGDKARRLREVLVRSLRESAREGGPRRPRRTAPLPA